MVTGGLLPSAAFDLVPGHAAPGRTLPQAAWYFRSEWVAVPTAGRALPDFCRELPVWTDLGRWAAETAVGAQAFCPPLVWVAAPEVWRRVRVTATGETLNEGMAVSVALSWTVPEAVPEGGTGRMSPEQPLHLVPRLPLNGSYFDATSARFFHGRPVKMRGNAEGDAFLARTLWPEDFCLPPRAELRPLPTTPPEPDALRQRVRGRVPVGEGAMGNTAIGNAAFTVESLWRRAGAGDLRPGTPVFGLMLNGAQGDDDEAHGGHFALVTGCIGAAGAIDDALVYNFYTLDAESEKGIIAAPVPLDNYLGDLNSGQAWYRPSWLLLATLRDARVAVHLDAALARVFCQFYRHQFAYQHARANCTGLSVDTLRTLGWAVPRRGAESWAKAVLALPWVACREGSLKKGKAAFDYLTEERTRLYPAVAFEAVGGDLLRLVRGEAGRPLGAFEQALAEDVEEILFLALPQFPSSRAWGDWPVADSREYHARLPADPAQQKIIPVPPRPFPPELRDPLSPREPPLRSDYALWSGCALLFAILLLILRQLLA